MTSKETNKEGGIKLGNRFFQFVKPTIESYVELAKHNKPFTQLDFNKIVDEPAEYLKFKKTWRAFCNSTFKKDSLWFLLSPFGYLPKELRFSSLKMSEIAEVRQSFFGWQEDGQSEAPAPSGTSSDSKPENE